MSKQENNTGLENDLKKERNWRIGRILIGFGVACGLASAIWSLLIVPIFIWKNKINWSEIIIMATVCFIVLSIGFLIGVYAQSKNKPESLGDLIKRWTVETKQVLYERLKKDKDVKQRGRKLNEKS